MGKKLHWHKTFSDRYLADREVIQLNLAEHGLLHIINCILRTQTDSPGRYIIRGRIGSTLELLKDVRMYAQGQRKVPRNNTPKYMAKCLTNVVQSHLLEIDNDGMIYSPYICQEVAESKVNELRGKLGGNPALAKGVNPPLKPEKKRREKKREEDNRNPEIVDNSGVSDPSARRGEPHKAARAGLVHIGDVIEKMKQKNGGEH